jgi:predicted RNA binding protein YcfA (HicA-like mRNA interferase family)
MSPKLPVISGEKLIKILVKKGFIIRRQTGSHIVLHKERIVFSVPNHKVLKKGTLRKILNQAEITIEELISSL